MDVAAGSQTDTTHKAVASKSIGNLVWLALCARFKANTFCECERVCPPNDGAYGAPELSRSRMAIEVASTWAARYELVFVGDIDRV